MIGPDNILGLTLSAQQVRVYDRRNYINIQNRSKIKARPSCYETRNSILCDRLYTLEIKIQLEPRRPNGPSKRARI